MKIFLYLLFLLIFILTGRLFAERTPEVIITGKSEEISEGEPGKTKKDLINENTVSPSLADILSRESGLRVHRSGGAGSYSVLSVRGSNANQTQFYLDDIPLNNSYSGEVNLSDLNPADLNSLVIRRSGGSPGSPMGGSVSLRTQECFSEDKTKGRVYAKAGYFDTATAGASAGHSSETSCIRASVHGETSRQNFEFMNNNGTEILNKDDDFRDTRRNADYKSAFARLSGGIRTESLQFTFLNDTASRQQGIPGPAAMQTDNTERWFFRNTAGLRVQSRPFNAGNWLTIRPKAALYFTRFLDKFYDPDQEFSSHLPGSRVRLHRQGFIAETEAALPRQLITLHLNYDRESMLSDSRNSDFTEIKRHPERTRNTYRVALKNEISIIEERWIITPFAESSRYHDRFGLPEDKATLLSGFTEGRNRESVVYDYPAFSLSTRIIPYKSDPLTFWIDGQAATGRRVPVFSEIFGEPSVIQPNPDLKPEKSRQYTGGAGASGNIDIYREFRWKAGINVFRKELREMILLVPNSRYSLRAENTDAALIQGAETQISGEIPDLFGFYINYTWQKAVNTGEISLTEGKYLPMRPMHDLTAGVSFTAGSWTLGAETDYTGAVYRSRSNDYYSWEGPVTLYHAFLRFRNKNITVSLEVKNLTDQNASDSAGYPLPGRAVYLGSEVKF